VRAEKAPKKSWREEGKTVVIAIVVAFLTAAAGDGAHRLFGGNGLPLPSLPKVLIDAEASLINPKGAENGAMEYVCLISESEDPVGMADWRLYDSEGKVDELSQFSLEPGMSVRVHPGGRGSQSNTIHDIYGNEDSHRWNNEGDTATLLNAHGEEIDSREFPARRDGDVSGNCGPPPDSDLGGRGEKDCSSFSTHAEAQAFFVSHRPGEDPYGLDADNDGVACESNP
jgi:hypothetical protein